MARPKLPYKKPYGGRIVIPEDGLEGREGHPYLADPQLIAAANAAVVLGRPLLLTGEPGCGKTDFAHAVARAVDATRPKDLRKGLFACQVRSDSTARELLYHYDALQRFGEAHMDGETRALSTDARRYVQLRPLGEALVAPQSQVVLIDEIDKAPRDLPNDLLRELDETKFEIKELRDQYPKPKPDELEPERLMTRWGNPLQRIMQRPTDETGDKLKVKPIIIITSNAERQLPPPFLRRCVFFHITFPSREQLGKIMRERFEGVPYVDQLVELFLALRAVPRLVKKPATSELIDWAEVLRTLHEHADVTANLAPLAAKVVRTPSGDSGDDARSLERDLWPGLVGLHCLLKLREDLATVGVEPRAAPGA